MKTLIALSLFIMFLVSVQFASAKTVDEVIDKYMKALGGKEKLNSIKSVYMEGRREMMGAEVTIKITKEQGRLSHTELEMGDKNSFNPVTEKESWNFFSIPPQEPQKEGHSVEMTQEETDIAGPLVDYVAKGHKAELEGKETVDGIICYKINLTTNAGKKITYWIQAGNYLLLQSSDMIIGKGRDTAGGGAPLPGYTGKTYILYKDYRAVDGILFAHTIETRTTEGELQGGITWFDKIELNKPVNEKLYKPE